MGMSNDEIDALMNGDTIAEEENSEQANPDEATEELPPEALAISQDEMDSLLATFVSDEETADHESLLEELHEAIPQAPGTIRRQRRRTAHCCEGALARSWA